jgi:hypothetical protein
LTAAFALVVVYLLVFFKTTCLTNTWKGNYWTKLNFFMADKTYPQNVRKQSLLENAFYCLENVDKIAWKIENGKLTESETCDNNTSSCEWNIFCDEILLSFTTELRRLKDTFAQKDSYISGNLKESEKLKQLRSRLLWVTDNSFVRRQAEVASRFCFSRFWLPIWVKPNPL